VRGRVRQREHRRHDLVGGALDHHAAADGEPGRPAVAGGAHDVLLAAAGAGGQRRPAGQPHRAEVGGHQVVDRVPGRLRVRHRLVGLDAAMRGGAHVYPGAADGEHAAHPVGDQRLIHPMERLGERHHAEGAQAGGQLLGAQHVPVDVRCPPARFGDHPGVRVDPDGGVEERREQQVSEPGPQPTSSRRPVPSRASSSRRAPAIAVG
jgi:hypothetical protein